MSKRGYISERDLAASDDEYVTLLLLGLLGRGGDPQERERLIEVAERAYAYARARGESDE